VLVAKGPQIANRLQPSQTMFQGALDTWPGVGNRQSFTGRTFVEAVSGSGCFAMARSSTVAGGGCTELVRHDQPSWG